MRLVCLEFKRKDEEHFYYPLPGETASNIEANASHVHRLMYIETNNLIIENIEFRHCGRNILVCVRKKRRIASFDVPS